MCSLLLDIPCEECGADCNHVLCDKHLDRQNDKSFEEGKKAGYNEGYEAAQKELSKE